jgi:hypothetical protein
MTHFVGNILEPTSYFYFSFSSFSSPPNHKKVSKSFSECFRSVQRDTVTGSRILSSYLSGLD